MTQVPSELDSFFEGLPQQDKQVANVFDEKKTPEADATPEKEETAEDAETRKNRRHRRLEEALQRERESNIALNERLKTLAEFDKTIKETSGEIDPDLIKIFGTTPEAKEVARLFTAKLEGLKESAKAEALSEIDGREQGFQQETKQYESYIDDQLESLEEAYGVDLTSDTKVAEKARREFLGLVEALSPKDEDGSIKDYADFNSTFEIYQNSRQEARPDNSRQKEIASKSMQRSSQNGSGAQSQITPGFRGWERDYGLQ